ncbi:MAG TPA: class I SAM-dependent methyltransferase [Pseudomonadota bacterium]|nr:class I SAM-dependent methyltransferase [Pseudomonadota bacterium]
MTTLLTPRVSQLLDELFLAATAADAPILARMRALAPAARDDLLRDYRRLYGAAKEAYLAVSREVGVFLYTQARAAAATRIVEFGTSFGLSTIYLAAALRDSGGGTLISTELDPDKAARATANLERAGLADLVEIRVGDALDSLRALPGGIDLLYLDGAKTLYREVLARCEPHLRTGALIIADNIDMAALVAPYTTYVREPTNGYLSSRVVLGDGLEVSLRLA